MLAAVNLVFSAVQIFNRRSIGYLWDKRGDLDPGQTSIINSIYNNKKKGSALGAAEQKITYKLSSKAAGKLGYGRLYGTKGSFETLEKECRGTICKEYYHDIDIVNCHPVLLLQFAKKQFQTDLPEVDKYVINREVYLKNVMTENSITRDEAKAAIISVLYGGSCNQKSYLYDLSLEVRGFSKKVFASEQYADLAKVCKGEDNIYGTFLSFVLQTEERHCMLAMKEHLEAEKWSVDVFCYDGVMVRKQEGKIVNLVMCQEAVEAKTGYKISLVTKEFSSFEMPSVSEEVVKGVTLDAYNEMKQEFEKTNFFYGPTNEYVEYVEGKEPLHMGLQHATEYYRNKWYFKHSDKLNDYTQFFPLWRENLSKRVIMKFSFEPDSDSEVFQIPMKLAYQKLPPFAEHSNPGIEVLDDFLTLVHLVCNKRPELERFTLDWLAHMLQKPYELPRVALVVTGEKGVGKDTLFDFFMKYVIGTHFSTNFTDTKSYFEKHNCDRMYKVLIKLEEADAKACWENANVLKGRITSESDKFNPKGEKPIMAENIARIVMTTNGACPVDMKDKERRFVLLNCSSDMRGNSEFWHKIRKSLFNPEAGRWIADVLLERPLDGLDFNTLPQNDYQEAVIEARVSVEERFIQQWDGKRATAREIYDLYKEFCRAEQLPMIENVINFGKALVVFVRNGTIETKISNQGQRYWKPEAEK